MQVQPLPGTPSVLEVLAAFKAVAAEAPEDLEAVGSFILRLRPELEDALRAALTETTAPKKRFKL
jgi:hypothetical protein